MKDPQLQVNQDRFFQEFLRHARANDILPSGTKVLVAISGGLDSTVLAQVLARARRVLGLEVEFAHVDHCTRGLSSEREGAWVRVLGERLAIKTHLLSVASAAGITLQPKMPTLATRGLSAGSEWATAPDAAAAEPEKFSGEGLSQAELRDLRRRVLLDCAALNGAQVIATAHHADDNAETFLMRAIQGTGLYGLAGIAPREGLWVRPLLFAHRKDLEDYARSYRFGWVEDPSNARGVYLRNQLRNTALPMLEQLRQGAVKNLARAAERISEEEREWESWIESQLDGPVDTLPRGWVERWPDPLQRRIFRTWLRRLGLEAEPRLIEALMGGEELVHREGSFLRRSDMYVFLSERDWAGRFQNPLKVDLGKKIDLGTSTAWSFLPQAPERFKKLGLSLFFAFRAPEGQNQGSNLFAWDKLPWPLTIRARKPTDPGAALDRYLAHARVPRPFWGEWPVLVSRDESQKVVGLVGIGALEEYRLNGVGRCVSAECFFEDRLKAVSPS